MTDTYKSNLDLAEGCMHFECRQERREGKKKVVFGQPSEKTHARLFLKKKIEFKKRYWIALPFFNLRPSSRSLTYLFPSLLVYLSGRPSILDAPSGLLCEEVPIRDSIIFDEPRRSYL